MDTTILIQPKSLKYDVTVLKSQYFKFKIKKITFILVLKNSFFENECAIKIQK